MVCKEQIVSEDVGVATDEWDEEGGSPSLVLVKPQGVASAADDRLGLSRETGSRQHSEQLNCTSLSVRI